MTETQATELLAKLDALQELGQQLLVATGGTAAAVMMLFGWLSWVSFCWWIRKGNIL